MSGRIGSEGSVSPGVRVMPAWVLLYCCAAAQLQRLGAPFLALDKSWCGTGEGSACWLLSLSLALAHTSRD